MASSRPVMDGAGAEGAVAPVPNQLLVGGSGADDNSRRNLKKDDSNGARGFKAASKAPVHYFDGDTEEDAENWVNLFLESWDKAAEDRRMRKEEEKAMKMEDEMVEKLGRALGRTRLQAGTLKEVDYTEDAIERRMIKKQRKRKSHKF